MATVDYSHTCTVVHVHVYLTFLFESIENQL